MMEYTLCMLHGTGSNPSISISKQKSKLVCDWKTCAEDLGDLVPMKGSHTGLTDHITRPQYRTACCIPAGGEKDILLRLQVPEYNLAGRILLVVVQGK